MLADYPAGSLNDLWRYSTGSGQWIWESGASAADQPGTYGTRGLASAVGVPGARGNSVEWTDALGNLWLFGGAGASGGTQLLARAISYKRTFVPLLAPFARRTDARACGTRWAYGACRLLERPLVLQHEHWPVDVGKRLVHCECGR